MSFLKEAFSLYNFVHYKMVLVYCNKAIRHQRLANQRFQPELINNDMDNWADYLLHQAKAEQAFILDTTNLAISTMVD